MLSFPLFCPVALCHAGWNYTSDKWTCNESKRDATFRRVRDYRRDEEHKPCMFVANLRYDDTVGTNRWFGPGSETFNSVRVYVSITALISMS
jgi:hypothetical protein